jgi:hypothetical protein
MLLFFGLPALPWGRLAERLSRAAPATALRVEGVAFVAAAVLTVLIDGLPLLEKRLGYLPRAGAGDPIGAPLGFFQMAFYLAFALVARRALRAVEAGGTDPVA